MKFPVSALARKESIHISKRCELCKLRAFYRFANTLEWGQVFSLALWKIFGII